MRDDQRRDDDAEQPEDHPNRAEIVPGDDDIPETVVPRRKRPSNKILALTLFPIITISLVGTIINVFFRVYLSVEHPLLLLANDPRTLHMLLVEGRLDWFTYYPVVIVRRLIADPSHFLLGLWFGRAAIMWIKRHSPDLGEMAIKLEEWFPKFGWILIVIYPHPLVMVIAGASTMRFRTFIVLDFIGVLGAAIVVDLFGNLIEPQVKWLNGFISDYQIPLTVFSIGVFLVMYFVSGRNQPRQTTRSVMDELNSDHDDRGRS